MTDLFWKNRKSFLGPVARFGSPHRLRRQGVFRPMGNDYVSTGIASVYTVHVIMFLRGSVSVYIVHVVNISIGNYFAKPRRRHI